MHPNVFTVNEFLELGWTPSDFLEPIEVLRLKHLDDRAHAADRFVDDPSVAPRKLPHAACSVSVILLCLLNILSKNMIGAFASGVGALFCVKLSTCKSDKRVFAADCYE